mgnify:CR=1 FL=1
MKAVSIGKSELQRVMDIMALARDVDTGAKLPMLFESIGRLVPHEFGAIGSFRSLTCERLDVAHTTYHQEFTHLYVTQGFHYDPSVQLIQTTDLPMIFSVDRPYELPAAIEEVKLDFGIKTCMSVGVRGEQGTCTYYGFSNFDKVEESKLRMIMDMLGPHLHLAYMRCQSDEMPQYLPAHGIELTKRESDVVKWLCEGKSNVELSGILHLSERVVKFHLSNIYHKLGAKVRSQVIANYQWSEAGLLRRDSAMSKQAASV